MKKKIFAIALAVMLFVLAIAGSSVAYFTDTEKATNVFTAGDVDIQLTYTDIDSNVKVSDEETTQGPINLTTEGVYPGQTISVNATIKNVGTEEAYVGAIITLSEMGSVITEVGDDSDNIPVAVKNFITGLYTDADVKYVTDTTAGTITVYVLKATKLAAETGSCVIIEDVVIPTTWDNKEMAEFNEFTLDIKAYATQVKGFGSSTEAIKAAFGATTGTDWYPYFN